MSQIVLQWESDDDDTGSGTAVVTKPVVRTRKPSMYKVLLHNDDFTPMEFVVQLIEQVFNKSQEEATAIMLDVHRKGIGVCGVYPYDIAETKSRLVRDTAKENEYPLQSSVEKD